MTAFFPPRRRRSSDPLPWHPAVLPPPGFRLEHDGAVFESVQAVPHERSRYLNVWLVTWRTQCPNCGIAQTTTSTARGWQSLRRRHCTSCAAAMLEALQAERQADGTP